MRTFVLGFGIHICTQKQYDMKFVAEIDIMPLPALLDPQGKAVGSNMGNMGLPEIVGVRIGKHVTLEVEASDKAVAEKKVTEACEKLLVNQIMEGFTFRLEEV
jgi:phosphoribosylformylglycinamidine synthase subunit PurS